MGFTNVFIGCSLFDMHVKGGMKWLLLFVIQKVMLEWTNITLFPFFLMSNFGHVSIMMWFSSMIFHKTQMYATHIVVVMEASDKCMCSNTYAFESEGKYTHEQTTNNE